MRRRVPNSFTQRRAGWFHPEPKAEGYEQRGTLIDDRHAHFVCVGGAVGARCFQRTLIPKPQCVHESGVTPMSQATDQTEQVWSQELMADCR